MSTTQLVVTNTMQQVSFQDFPGIGATSVGGGDIYSTTIGLNYAFNKYAQVMLDYTWHRVNIDRLPHDKNVHAVQARVQFTF